MSTVMWAARGGFGDLENDREGARQRRQGHGILEDSLGNRTKVQVN